MRILSALALATALLVARDAAADIEANGGLHIVLDPFERMVRSDARSVHVSGRATSTQHAIASVTVRGVNVPLAADGKFAADVPIAKGVHVIPIEARDDAQPPNLRKAHRAVMSARYLPENRINGTGVAITLDETMLAAASAPLANEMAAMDLGQQIMQQRPMSQDDRCITYPRAARHDPLRLRLYRDYAQNLYAELTVPNLLVVFYGSCRGLIQNIPIDGDIRTTVVVTSRLTSAPGAECLTRFNHSRPIVELQNWRFDVRGSGLGGILVELLSGSRGAAAKEEFRTKFGINADKLLAQRLSNISLIDSDETLPLKGVPVRRRICLTDLRKEIDQLLALVGTRVSGPGGTNAPGAPQIDGVLPQMRRGHMWIDANLVSQLLFSSWRAGGLNNPKVHEIDVGLLAIVAPDLANMYPPDTMVTVSARAELPPLVRAAPVADGGDVLLEIADMIVELHVQGDLLFRLSASIKATLDLIPKGDALEPKVRKTEVVTHLLDEPRVDSLYDEVLESLVAEQIQEKAAEILEDAPIPIPRTGIVVRPHDVLPDVGGRYLRIPLKVSL